MSYPVLFTLSLDSQCGISLSTLTSNRSYSHYDAPAVTFPFFTRFWPFPANLDPTKSPIQSDRRKHCQRHNGPRILSPKLELYLKAETKCKFQFSTLSPPPLPGNHLCHLVHLPVILLAHHHLNDNRYLPMSQQHILSPT